MIPTYVGVNGKVYTHVDRGVMKDILDGLFPSAK